MTIDPKGPLPPHLASQIQPPIQPGKEVPQVPTRPATTQELLTWQCEILAEQRETLKSIRSLVSNWAVVFLLAIGALILVCAANREVVIRRTY